MYHGGRRCVYSRWRIFRTVERKSITESRSPLLGVARSVLRHLALEGYRVAGSGIFVRAFLGDQQCAGVSGLGRDVERHPGFALAYARERAGTDAISSRDEPELVVAVRFGLFEVVELQLHPLVA